MSPKVHLPLGSQRASGSIGKELSFSFWKGRQYVKAYGDRSLEFSLPQIFQQLYFQAKRDAWAALSQPEKDSWNSDAKDLGNPWSGYTLFMSRATIPPMWYQYLLDNFNLDAYPDSPDPMDDEFAGGGALDPKWTPINNPGAPYSFSKDAFPGFLWVGLPEIVGADNYDQYIQIFEAPPANNSTWKIIAKMCVGVKGWTGSPYGTYCAPYLALINSVNKQWLGIGPQMNPTTSSSIGRILACKHSAGSPPSPVPWAAVPSGTLDYDACSWVYVKLEKAQANPYTSANIYYCYYSFDGIAWFQVGYEPAFAFTSAPDRLGFLYRPPAAAAAGVLLGEAIVDFIRKIA